MNNFPGKVDIEKLDLITVNGGRFDLTDSFVEINVYEDMFANCMTGSILIEDTKNLISVLPIMGNETLSFSIRGINGETISRDFFVYRISNRTKPKPRKQNYVLHFCSPEMINDANRKISRSFKGKTSDVIKDIFTASYGLASKRQIYIEPSDNSVTFISPYWEPFKLINHIASLSKNSVGRPSYLFFESNKSYEFSSVETLLKQPAKHSYIDSDVSAENYSSGTSLNTTERLSVIKNIQFIEDFDFLKRLSNGMFSTKLHEFDTTTKRITTNTHDYFKEFNTYPHLESSPLFDKNVVAGSNAKISFVTKSSKYLGEFFVDAKSAIQKRDTLLQSIMAHRIVIEVFGRTDLKVGNVINVTMPKNASIDDGNKSRIIDDKYSGKYLVTAIRHKIIGNQHDMIVECSKESLGK
jgi:hypothetical protein